MTNHAHHKWLLTMLPLIAINLPSAKSASPPPPASYHAPTFQALIEKTNPTLTWPNSSFGLDGRDMLWATRDKKGKIIFVFNHAYRFKLSPKAQFTWNLLKNIDDYNWDSDQQSGDEFYERTTDVHPIIVASDPTRGIIYQARWPSLYDSGTAHFVYTRNFLLLCDSAHHWHFLGEAPVAISGKGEDATCLEEQIEIQTAWPRNPADPLLFSCTRKSTTSKIQSTDEVPIPDVIVRTNFSPVSFQLKTTSDGEVVIPNPLDPDLFNEIKK